MPAVSARDNDRQRSNRYNPRLGSLETRVSSLLLTKRQLNRATLARQMLLRREKITALKAVQRLVAMQAQVARPPFVGLWTRLEGFRREHLTGALRQRKLVRATALRGTLHLMTAGDYVALRGALQPMLTAIMQGILRERLAGLDIGALEATARAFFGKEPETFDALRSHLKRKHPKGDERAMAYAIRTHLPLVQVPTEERWGFPASADFAVADAWLGRKVATQPAGPERLVLRYLAAFGPASVRDAEVWCYLRGLRDVFEALRPKLATFRDERKRELFDLPDAPRPAEDTPAPVRFLPEFDNLVLSHEDRTRVLADEHRGRIFTKNLLVHATFLADGFVAGTWKIERKKTVASLALEPFGTLAKATRAALEQEGEALLRFVEEDAQVRNIRWAG
jgi:hypothetical protein